MKKRVALLLIIAVFLVLAFPVFALAAADDGRLVPDTKLQEMERATEDASLTDKILMRLGLDILKIRISGLGNLVFGNPYKTWGFKNSDQELKYGVFLQNELDSVINPLIAVFSGAYVSILTLAIMFSTLKLGLRAYSPQSKADFWTDINMYVFSTFFMASFWLLFRILMDANHSIVTAIGDQMNASGVDPNGISLIATGTWSIGNMFVFLAEWGLGLYLNIIYIARKIVIILLVVMAPVAAYSLLFAKTRAFFGTWFKELVGNIFLQSIHAVILFTFSILASPAVLDNGFGATVFKLGMIIMFVPVTGMVTRWLNLGDSSSKLGQTANMMGAGSIAGALMLAKGAGGIIGGARASAGGAAPGAGGSAPSTGDMGSDKNLTAISQSSAAGGTGWQKIRSVAAGIGAVAGGTMGLAFGPAGVALGAGIGAKASSGFTQASRNLSSGLANTTRTVSGMKNYEDANGNKGFAAAWSDLSARRQFMGNIGESLGVAVGGQAGAAIGRDLGMMASGVSRQRVHNDQFGGKTVEDYQQQYAGQDVFWEQDNQKSAYYVNDGGRKVQISAFGAGDTSLRNGEIRKADYKFRGSGDQWKRQENGTYTSLNSSGQTATIYGATGLPESAVPVGGSATGGTREIAGLSGSTEHLGRSSGAYIETADGKRFEDDRYDMKRLNPDSYFTHSTSPTKRDVTDWGADALHWTNTKAQDNPVTNKVRGWAAQDLKNAAIRHSGVF